MKRSFLKSIQEAKYLINKISDPAHNIIHTQGVVNTALNISKNFPTIDSDIIEVSAWWHDVGRLYNEDHENLSAQMAYQSLKRLGVEDIVCKKIFDAIVFHKRSMSPKTLEGEIIRDADKLDFLSVARRENCIKNNDYHHLYDIAKLIPSLNNILHLPFSKELLDNKLNKFYIFIKKLEEGKKIQLKEILQIK